MADINLLPIEEKASENFANLQKRISIASIVFLAITAVLTLSTLGFFTSLAGKRADLIGRIVKSSGEINNYKAQEELNVVVKSKAKAAEAILAARTNHPSLFSKLSQLIPQNVYFTDIKFVGTKASFSGRAKSSADVAGLVSSLLSPDGSKTFSQVTIDSLNSDETGAYSFSMSLAINK